MRYIRTAAPVRSPQILQISHRQQLYDFALLHAEQEDYRYLANENAGWGREHAHHVYHIALYSSGENEFLLNGVRHPVRRGMLAMTAPGEPHLFSPCHPGSATSRELTFRFEHGNAWLQMPVVQLLSLICGVDLPPTMFPVQLTERNTRLIEITFDHMIQRLATRDAFCWFAEQQLMLELFSHLLNGIFDAPHSDGQLHDPLLHVHAEIERRYNERLTVDELAQQVFLSAGYLTRAFKSRYGLPPIAFQQVMRVEAAKTLLTTTARSITEIAGMVGYQEIGSFSKVFIRHTGLSPLAYRKQQHG